LIGIGLFATFYTAIGGIRAVVWTDVLQAATLGGGMVIVLLLTLRQIDGGWSTVMQIGSDHDKFRMLEISGDLRRQDLTFFSAVALGLFAYLPGYAVAQTTVQRYLCMDRLGVARRALLINAVVATVVAVLFFFVGTTLFVYYQQPSTPGLAEVEQALEKRDQIMPHFVLNEVTCTGLGGLLLAGLFAAVMSTIDSGINSLTAVIVYDWLGGRHEHVGRSRLLCIQFGIAVIVAALVAPYLGDSVIGIIMKIAGAFLGLLFGLYLMGLLVPRANTGGAVVGLVAGVLCLAVAWGFLQVAGWWYGAFTCIPVFVCGSLASLLFPPPGREQRRGLVFARQ
jgi:Na+/proline symporter